MTITTFAARVKRLDFFAPKLTINLLGEEPYNLEDFATRSICVEPIDVRSPEAVVAYMIKHLDKLDRCGAYLHIDSLDGTASIIEII